MINVDIKKPIFGEYVAIRDKYLKLAIKDKTPIRLTTPTDTYVVDPKIWIKTGKKISKVFLIEDQPMILYANYANKFPLEERIVAEAESLGLTGAMAKHAEGEAWEKLRKILH